MVYQVMLQTATGWALFSRPTANAREAFELARLSAGYAPGMEACVLCAATLSELRERCAQWQREHAAHAPRAAPASAPQTAEQWHALMNALELGPGGAHDEPYTYHPPPHRALASAWLRLAARVTRGEVGGAMDGSACASHSGHAAPDHRAIQPGGDAPSPHAALDTDPNAAGAASWLPSASPA